MMSESVIHLYNLSHVLATGPMSKKYAVEFADVANHQQINLPEVIDDAFCNGCGVISIPGITSSSRISYRKLKKKKKKNASRRLVIRCLECNHTKEHDSLVTQSIKPINSSSSDVSNKKQSRKRKTNDLSSLLAAKKKQETKKTSLDLMEFMK